ASRRREAETRAQSQKLKPKQKVEPPIVEKRSANGVLLLSKPKSSKAYGYCFQLDELDNLNTLKSKKKYVLPAKHPKGENEMDPERPWRKNMIKTNQSKIKLIKLNDQDIKKECNGMTFDEKSQSWQGNEKALLAFQDKAGVRRPMLISNRQQTSKYTSVIVNNMIFDTEKLQWVSAFGPEAEHNELDEIEDLKEDTVYRVGKKNNQEFKLSVETKREMMFDQERHETYLFIIKQDIAAFLKKRAFLEESYGRDMIKIAQQTAEAFDKSHPKSGTFGDVWISILKVHETIGNQRIRFATSITESAEDLLSLSKHIEKDRKKIKDTGMHYEKQVQEADIQLEKSKQKFEATNEEWGKAVSQRNQEPTNPGKKNLFRSSRTAAQLDRNESDCRSKMDAADTQYKLQQKKTIQAHTEYYETHLPKVLSVSI
ncbi:hypothetical protein CU097_001481, partial [Rhizopus azygosporus]